VAALTDTPPRTAGLPSHCSLGEMALRGAMVGRQVGEGLTAVSLLLERQHLPGGWWAHTSRHLCPSSCRIAPESPTHRGADQGHRPWRAEALHHSARHRTSRGLSPVQRRRAPGFNRRPFSAVSLAAICASSSPSASRALNRSHSACCPSCGGLSGPVPVPRHTSPDIFGQARAPPPALLTALRLFPHTAHYAGHAPASSPCTSRPPPYRG
jgi:hypothetical protein